MAFVSPALVSRIFQALGQNRGAYAVRLLRQHQFESGDNPAGDGELLGSLLSSAHDCSVEGDLGRAEDHYRLALALYEHCFFDRHVDALQCCTGLLSVLERSNKSKDCLDVFNRMASILTLARQQMAQEYEPAQAVAI